MHSCYSSAVPDWLIFMIAASVIVSAGAGLAIRGALWFGAVVVAMVPARRLLQRVALDSTLATLVAGSEASRRASEVAMMRKISSQRYTSLLRPWRSPSPRWPCFSSALIQPGR